VKFLLDHDVPDDLSYLLEQLGHTVVLLRKALPAIPPTRPFSGLPTRLVAYSSRATGTISCISQRQSHTMALSLESTAI
jgi:hypothetical protein